MPDHHSPYKEVIPAPMWVWLTLGLSLFLYIGLRKELPTGIGLWDLVWGLAILFVVGVILLLARLAIRVDEMRILVRFGFISLIEKEIVREHVESAEAITYRPIRQFGGWGIRRGQHRRKPTGVYSICGASGVLLTLTQPMKIAFGTVDQVLIGNMDSSRLAAYLSRQDHL